MAIEIVSFPIKNDKNGDFLLLCKRLPEGKKTSKPRVQDHLPSGNQLHGLLEDTPAMFDGRRVTMKNSSWPCGPCVSEVSPSKQSGDIKGPIWEEYSNSWEAVVCFRRYLHSSEWRISS